MLRGLFFIDQVKCCVLSYTSLKYNLYSQKSLCA